MGYRSDVAMLITSDEPTDRKIEELMVHLKLAQVNLRGWTGQEWAKDPFMGWNHHTLIFKAENVKWYLDYDEVKAIEEVWEIAKKVTGLSGVFLRIGEESDDVVDENFGEDPHYQDAYITRQIFLPEGLPFGEFGDEVPHMEREETK
jgi:hypothetical protein